MADHQKNDSVPVITIDGPSGSGKGTISQLLARTLGWNFLDSGALYRLVTLAGRQMGVEPADAEALARVAAGLDVVFAPTDKLEAMVLLSGVDVGSAIREESIGVAASQVAVHTAVREALLERQRQFAVEPGLVADGRDMGTMVFPGAQLKIFLTASAEERAARRCKQLKDKGESVSLSRILQDIKARDERDSQRAVSPLKPAADAVILDSTHMSIEQVQRTIYARAEALALV